MKREPATISPPRAPASSSAAGSGGSAAAAAAVASRRRAALGQWGTRSVDAYEKLEQIGEGTYGQVYRARERATGEVVALKKVRMDHEKEGFPITALREIRILKQLRHANIVQLKEIVTSKSAAAAAASGAPGGQPAAPAAAAGGGGAAAAGGADAADKEKGSQPGSIYMVFEYMDHDLAGLMELPLVQRQWFSAAQIKCYMKQLLEALFFCHRNHVLHRDIKASNLLISNRGELKLADFGLARPFQDNDQRAHYTNRVITLWYRPPELLLGATAYGPAVDMWSVGCIFAELLTRRPLFPGRTEIDQLEQIFKLCGTPSRENWPGAEALPWYGMFRPQTSYARRVREVFTAMHVPAAALDLLDALLQLDPRRRLDTDAALNHDYFFTDPPAAIPASLPRYPTSHEYQAKKRRASDPNAPPQAQPPPAPLPTTSGSQRSQAPPSYADAKRPRPDHGGQPPPPAQQPPSQQQQQQQPRSYYPPQPPGRQPPPGPPQQQPRPRP